MSRILEGLATHWRLDPALMLSLLCAAGLYLLGVRRAARWPARRSIAFLAGLGLLAVGLQSGLHVLGEQLLSVHMVQHLLLTLVVAPLLLLGAPVSLALRALPRAPRRALVGAVHGRFARGLARPAVGWALLSGALVLSHLPALYDAALHEPLLHGAEHLVYLGASLVFWLPLVGSEPLARPPSPLARMLALLAAMPPMALVGLALLTSGEVAYPFYTEAASGWGVTALGDQHAGGAVMWVGGAALLAPVALCLGWSGLRREEERQRLRERYAERRTAA